VFRDFVHGTTAVHTDPDFNRLLATTEVIEIVAIASLASGTSPTLTVRSQVSGDNRNWANKSSTAEISALSLSTSAQTIGAGKSGITDPTSGFVRLAISLGGTSPGTHVEVWVTGRGNLVLDGYVASRRVTSASNVASAAPMNLISPSNASTKCGRALTSAHVPPKAAPVIIVVRPRLIGHMGPRTSRLAWAPRGGSQEDDRFFERFTGGEDSL
jgi:hypothetical protein